MKIINSLALLFMGLMLTQCYPDGPDYVEELDMTYTNYDTKYDFKSKGTYAMSDSILIIDEDILDGSTTRPRFVRPIYASPVLKTIDDNMEALGWTKVLISQNPDVLIQNAYTELTTTYLSYYGGYWDWWYGGYYPYYGYGWYYPYPVSYSYTTGNLITTLVDPNDFNITGQARVAWISIVNGLADVSSDSYYAQRIQKGVGQAFIQSPYLNTK